MESFPHETEQTQLQVKFITRDPDIAVSTTPILVPSKLGRLGLSQIVNHLLDRDSDKPTPFDFLVDGSFLRTSLENYLTQNGLSSESIITLEYVRATLPPKPLSSFQHDDWVSSVSVSSYGSQPVVLSGSYDGIARIWSSSGQVLAEASGHTAAIKSVKWIDSTRFVTAGMDRTMRIWNYKEDALEGDAVTPVAELFGHRSTVENIVTDAGSNYILSGSSDGSVGVWTKILENLPPAAQDLIPSRRKKRKVEASSRDLSKHGPVGRLENHTAPVSGVCFEPKDKTVAYSVSWDHTIRTWDLPTMVLVDTRTTQHPLLSICSLQSLSLLVCGSSARHITLHDPRASASSVASSVLHGHSNAVVALHPSPSNEWQLASASHDGTVRIWDVRATDSTNLFTIRRERGSGPGREKVFDVEWSSIGIVSGGEDKCVQINEMQSDGSTVVEKGRL